MNYFNQESARLQYRKLTYADLKSWEEFFVDNDRIHFLGLNPKKSKEELSKESIDRQIVRYKDDKNGLLAVIEKSSGELIGLSGLLTREIEGKIEYEIGYSLKSRFWKHGFATEAAKQMKKFGLEAKIAKRFISIIHKDNIDSFAVAERNRMFPYLEITFMGIEVIVFSTSPISE
jgi:ribosomal-protein-alanine N-acetyltransferase